ncbi:type III secretion system gatekeeper subunit SctW [Burkholderia ubonensis]|uniref:type III secretion system gatekeeper subunit SctW n=1 Tax=Burkholderia ubonensis TaxID=101571 RepID=UPI00075419F1|nr:type III secretion system gatekeeper subunit SctW [Burkholderia ubonensis]KVX77015.1 secretion protein [Burkholderia ubonensis]
MVNGIDPQGARHILPSTPSDPVAVPLAKEMVPAQSALDLVQDTLADLPNNLGAMPRDLASVSADSFAETLEDIGFAVGTRMREPRRARADGSTERPRTRSMLQQLIRQIGAVSTAQLDDLRRRIPGLDELEDAGDAMSAAGMNDGEMALLLGAMLEEGKLSGARRRRIEDRLATVLNGDEWALQLFSHLEFGRAGRAGQTELRQLYQRAAAQERYLTQWFDEFRRLTDRRRKLKTLIRALAFELSSEGPATDTRLAAVINDLKRILQFLGIEDHCKRFADNLQAAGVDSDTLIAALLEIVEQTWLSASWLDAHTHKMISAAPLRYRYARGTMELVKLLPDACFEDVEQRTTILDAFSEHLEALIDMEA